MDLRNEQAVALQNPLTTAVNEFNYHLVIGRTSVTAPGPTNAHGWKVRPGPRKTKQGAGETALMGQFCNGGEGGAFRKRFGDTAIAPGSTEQLRQAQLQRSTHQRQHPLEHIVTPDVVMPQRDSGMAKNHGEKHVLAKHVNILRHAPDVG